MKLSIIVPVYNVEAYIKKCIESLLTQDIDDYEILIINDGSTDSSIDILNSYYSKNTNIRIINQENQGQSIARNNGISIAKGKYIMFVDSDDYIKENCLGRLLNYAEKNCLDILAYNYAIEKRGEVSFIERNKVYDNFLSPEDFLCNGLTMLPVWFCLFKKELFVENKLYFKEKVYHEDLLLMFQLVFSAKKMMMTDQLVYYYVKRENSSLSNKSKENRYKIFKDALIVTDELNRYLNKINIRKDKREEIYNNFIYELVIFSLVQPIILNIFSANQIKELYRLFSKGSLYPLSILNLKKNRIWGWIINHYYIYISVYFSHVYCIYRLLKNRLW